MIQGLETCLFLLVTVWPWVSYLTSLIFRDEIIQLITVLDAVSSTYCLPGIVITSTLYHLLISTMKWSLCCDYYPHFIDGKTDAKGSSVTSPRHAAIMWQSLLPPASHLGQDRACPGPCQISVDGRWVWGKAGGDHVLGRITQLRLLPQGRERVQKGAEKPACLFVPSSLPLGTMCSESVTIKSIPLKTGAVQALSPPGDFFCRLFCSLQETLRMLLGTKKERKPSPYIINPKNAGGAAEIQETNGNLIHNVRRGPDSTISRQACAITKIRTLVTHSFNKHSQCITLCASPEGICSPWRAQRGSLILSH